MRPWLCGSVIALLLLCAVVQAQVVQWDIQGLRHRSQLSRRAAAVHEERIQNERVRGGYFSTIQVGNPAQNVTLLLDTGSSDVWVPWCGASVCHDSGCPLGTFNPTKSDSFNRSGPGLFKIIYDDNRSCKGDYFSDQFAIGGVNVENFTMGLGLKADIHYGLIGIGYALNEALVDTANATYPNLPVAMLNGGFIHSIAYSLWLNDLEADTGNILFGGTDRAKYTGDLKRIPIQSEGDGTHVNLKVSMTSLVAESPSGSDSLMGEYPIDVVLDSGTTLTYLPQDLVTQAWQEVGAEYSQEYELAILPCSFANHSGHFSFGFAGPDGPRINITMDELVVDLTNGNPPTFQSGKYEGKTMCQFGIQNYTSTWYTLGTSFLRSAYVVYDLVNNEIGLAATKFNSTDSDIQAFESQGAAIPFATTVSDHTQTTQTPESTQNGFKAADGLQGNTKNAASSTRPHWMGVSATFFIVGVLLQIF